jgi:hypothetical protein
MTRATETWHERRERYLRYAAEAESAALRCGDGRVKDAYVHIAKSWTALAYEFGIPANDHIDVGSDIRP